MDGDGLLPKHGGYKRLKSFQLAELCYDITIRFCDRYVDKFSRTHDQMVQAARSGSRNISEGSEASGTSKKTELKLTGVAWASLGELEKDYKAFLRNRGLKEWGEGDSRRKELVQRRCETVQEVAGWVKEIRDRGMRHGESATYAEVAANAALVLIGVARALTNRLKHSQAEAFEKEGGFTERLYRVRSEMRGRGADRRRSP